MGFDLDKMYCAAIRRGDIFICEDKKGKESIMVVLQEDILNQGLPSVVCAVVEPYKKGYGVFENEVLLTDEETGLGDKGICMLHKIKTMDRRGMIAKKGELTDEKLQEIYHALDINLGRFRDKRR